MVGPVKLGLSVEALVLLIDFRRELTHLGKPILFFLPQLLLDLQAIATFGHFFDRIIKVIVVNLCSLVFDLIDGFGKNQYDCFYEFHS